MALFFPSRWVVQEGTEYFIRILGTGAANPTKQEGEGVTVTRTGAGAYRITFAEQPFQFIGATAGLLATTNADLKGYTVVFTDYDSTNLRLDFVVYNSSFAATDLAAAQRLCIRATFARTGY